MIPLLLTFFYNTSSSSYYITHYVPVHILARCWDRICLSKWFLCLALLGQYGHWNCGSLPHSRFKCRSKFFLYV